MDQSLGTSTSFCSKMMPPWESDLSETEIPFDLVVGRDGGLGEEAAEGEAGGFLLGLRQGGSGRGGGGFGYGFQFGRLDFCHLDFCHQGALLIRFYACCSDSGVQGAGGESGWNGFLKDRFFRPFGAGTSFSG